MQMKRQQTRNLLITHIVGARPNFPKASPVINALSNLGAKQRLVHTGQHYDAAMSDSFFRELALPVPDANLGIGSGSHAQQTAALLLALDAELTENLPKLLVVYGDINSTVAAALVAAKLGIPVAHVESGLRSFDRGMPEEINRVITDQISNLLFTTSPEATDNLLREGIDSSAIHFVGNPMIDTLLAHMDAFDSEKIQNFMDISRDYVVATLHRPSNVDDSQTSRDLVAVLREVAQQIDIVLPLHPRGRAALVDQGLLGIQNIMVVDPLGYLDFISLVRGSKGVITDSGGVQEETTVLGIPCLTLRANTERPITIMQGTNQLVKLDSLARTVQTLLSHRDTLNLNPNSCPRPIPPLWDGNAGERIANIITEWMATA